jgi:hypothetical protein
MAIQLSYCVSSPPCGGEENTVTVSECGGSSQTKDWVEVSERTIDCWIRCTKSIGVSFNSDVQSNTVPGLYQMWEYFDGTLDLLSFSDGENTYPGEDICTKSRCVLQDLVFYKQDAVSTEFKMRDHCKGEGRNGGTVVQNDLTITLFPSINSIAKYNDKTYMSIPIVTMGNNAKGGCCSPGCGGYGLGSSQKLRDFSSCIYLPLPGAFGYTANTPNTVVDWNISQSSMSYSTSWSKNIGGHDISQNGSVSLTINRQSTCDSIQSCNEC